MVKGSGEFGAGRLLQLNVNPDDTREIRLSQGESGFL